MLRSGEPLLDRYPEICSDFVRCSRANARVGIEQKPMAYSAAHLTLSHREKRRRQRTGDRIYVIPAEKYRLAV
jgi:hypothetical protein